MRVRFWIGLLAVFLVGGGSIAAAVIVKTNEAERFDEVQREQATRSARQAESLARLSLGQLASAAAFFRAEDHYTARDFDIIAEPLLQHGALNAAAFIQRVPASRRRAFEARHGVPIFEPTASGPVKARPSATYFPVVFAVSAFGTTAPVGYDLASDPLRGPALRRAARTGEAVASPPVKLLIGGLGFNVYRPVYRVGDLAAAANGSVPGPVDVQLHVAGTTVGDSGDLVDTARAPIRIADRTLLLVLSDPNRPGNTLPVAIGGVGISLAILLAALIVVWTRNERFQELRREARQDPLTGLKNRRSFDDDLRREVARSNRHRTPGALLMIDLDHFKHVNDTFGHPAGDRLIKEVAAILRERVRESDVLARLGGDEFAVILPNTSVTEARLVAEAIVATIRDRSLVKDEQGVTASVGIAVFGDDPRHSPESIVSEADTAMYAAKDGGRDSVRLFDRQVVRNGHSGG